MRPVTACDACRSNKRKCRLDSNDTVCTRCRELNRNCSLRGWTVRSPYTIPTLPTLSTPRLAPHPPRSPEILTSQTTDSPPVELQKELVALYFLVVHDTHHSITDGEFPDVLLYSVMSLGAPFSDNPVFANIDRRRRGDQYTERARKLLDLTDISVTTIQASILPATVCFCDSQTEAEALYYSIAIRLALILDLPNRKCDDQLERQINLRIWWSSYMIDIWSSMGLNLPRQLDFVERYPLPANEEVFLSLRPGIATPENMECPGLCSEMAILARKWARIHRFNKAAVNSFIDWQSVSTTVDSFARELQAWSDSLPSYLQETPDNLERYCSLGLGNAFAALHLGYHYYNEVLFYQFLATKPNHEHVDSISWYRSQCEEHALAFCNLLYCCRSTNQIQFQCLYVMVGHMLVVTSTVYIHMLVSSDNEAKIKLARQRLGQNFQILTEMQTYWVSLDVFLSRLQVFHNACIRSIDESFRMDQWMLSFLLEHGTTVRERPLNSDSPDTLRNWFLQTF